MKKIRCSLEESEGERMLPDYDDRLLLSSGKLEGDDLWSIFCTNFEAVSGLALDQVSELVAFLKQQGSRHGYCDPVLMGSVGDALVEAGFEVETVYDRDRYDDYQFGITRAAAVIAESGSVVLNDESSSDRLAALAPWIHVAVMDGDTLTHRSIPDAVAGLGASPNVVWATGPSKTADVEGILIEGVHGPGVQILLRSKSS